MRSRILQIHAQNNEDFVYHSHLGFGSLLYANEAALILEINILTEKNIIREPAARFCLTNHKTVSATAQLETTKYIQN